jgi:poly-gamma-glutamate synthesis protein (capsule biosynthesis protein)
LGTVYSKDAQKYLVKNINGIRIGMVCYTFETGDAYPDRPSINGLLTSEASVGHINSFDYNQLDKFYAELEGHMANMKSEGADATILYIHWGNEYQLSPTSVQKKIAQKICDLGIDVIVGGHPHVIQPMDLLQSTVDTNHKTVCLYSTGNFLSNQRRNLMDLKTGNTEDGIIFSVSFTKYSDGTVLLEDANVIPTWINLHKENGKNCYCILPLDKSVENWKEAYKLSDSTLKHAEESFERTMSLVGDGLEKTKTYLKETKDAFLINE